MSGVHQVSRGPFALGLSASATLPFIVIGSVALFIIGALGVAQIMSPAAVAYSAIGGGAVLFVGSVFGTLGGSKGYWRVSGIIYELLHVGALVTLGGLCLAQVLTVQQIGIGILVIMSPYALAVATGLVCMPCCSLTSSCFGIGLATGSVKMDDLKNSFNAGHNLGQTTAQAAYQ